MDRNRLARRIRMAAGREPADLRIVNAHVADVFSHSVLENTTLRVGDGVFLGFGDGPAHAVLDARGRYLLPGLMDAHVHIESAMLTPPQFARLTLPFGTTCVVADPHEIANVLGAEGLRYMLDSTEHLPLHVRFMLPSCVPAASFERAGAVLAAADLAPFMDHPRVCGLGEMMNYPGVVDADPDALDKICLAMRHNKPVDGHAPGLEGETLDAYIGAGMRTDHECRTLEEMRARIRRGMYVLIRQGSAARDLPELIKGVAPGNVHRCLLCTDDRHPGDILENGHMDHLLRLAVRHGLDPLSAVRMATLNTALCFGMPNKGGVAPGLDADFLLVEDLRDFRVTEVYAGGEKAAENGVLCVPLRESIPPSLTRTVRPAPLRPEDLVLRVPTGRARVIGVQPHSLTTRALERSIAGGEIFDAARNPGLVKAAVIERHKGTGHVGLGIMEGYTAKDARINGAIASTIAHDSHNIVVVGDNDADMLAAVADLRAMGGGITLTRGGETADRLPLPVAGLMSARGAEEVHASVQRMLSLAWREFGVSPHVEPFMTLSFMALAVMPELKLTAQGLFDVRCFEFVPVGLE